MPSDPTTPAMPILTRQALREMAADINGCAVEDLRDCIAMAVMLHDLREGVETLATEWDETAQGLRAGRSTQADRNFAFVLEGKAEELRALPHVGKGEMT